MRMIIRYSSSALSFYQAGESQALFSRGGIGGKQMVFIISKKMGRILGGMGNNV